MKMKIREENGKILSLLLLFLTLDFVVIDVLIVNTSYGLIKITSSSSSFSFLHFFYSSSLYRS